MSEKVHYVQKKAEFGLDWDGHTTDNDGSPVCERCDSAPFGCECVVCGNCGLKTDSDAICLLCFNCSDCCDRYYQHKELAVSDERSKAMKREPVVKIFKDRSKGGNGTFAISTTAADPDEFLRECAQELEFVSTELVGDLEFTYLALLPQICEVWAKLRGYKADTVFERKILTIGEPQPEKRMTLLNARNPVEVESLTQS